MAKTCLKCNFENTQNSIGPASPCPNCGAIYAKVEAHIKRQKQHELLGMSVSKEVVDELSSAPKPGQDDCNDVSNADVNNIIVNKVKENSVIILVLLALVVGYLVGREYTKYEIRSIMQSTDSWPVATKAHKPAAPSSAVHSLGDVIDDQKVMRPIQQKGWFSDQPDINIKLVRKGYEPRNSHNNKYQAELTFMLKVANKTNRDIRSIFGLVVFLDDKDEVILTKSVLINDEIFFEEVIEWSGYIRYDPLKQGHKELRDLDLKNLKVMLQVSKLTYFDGTEAYFY